jgi:hypothetical protein
MRPTFVLGGLPILLILAGPAAAQEKPYTATVVVDQADVRCLPSDKPEFYATNQLRRGERVEVRHRRDDGWLEITPPRGSFSWIDTRSVQHMVASLPMWVVTDTKAAVYVGSEVQKDSKEHPTIKGCEVSHGTQLRAIGQPLADSTGTWLPVEPPDAEVRYIKASFVQAEIMLAAASSATGNVAEAVVRTSAPSMTIPAPPQQTQPSNATVSRVGDGSAPAPADGGRLYPLPADAPPPPKVTLAPPSHAATASASTSAFVRPPDPAGQMTAVRGWLRPAGRIWESRKTYVLEPPPGKSPSYPRMYVHAQPGVDLEPYVGKYVELSGPAFYSGELRANYMAAAQVQLVP